MGRSLAIIGLFFLLGCAGVQQGLAEWISGSEIDVAEDGSVTITNADGSSQVVTQGDQATRPIGFPIPEPPGEASLDSVLTGSKGSPTTLAYRLGEEEDAEALLAFYQEWFAGEGIDAMVDSKNMAGMKTSAIVGSVDGVMYAVTFTDALGTRMLTLAVTPAH